MLSAAKHLTPREPFESQFVVLGLSEHPPRR
jgi:hypothetical protein